MESLPYWPEDSDIVRPIPANTVTDKTEIKQEKEGDNVENNDDNNDNNNSHNNNNNKNKANVRSMEAYTRVIESVLFNTSKKELFPSIKEVLLQWKIYGNALKIVENSIHNSGNNDGDSDDDNEYKRIKEKEIEKNKERDKDREKDKEKEKDKRIQISKRREEQHEEEEMKNNNNNSNNLNNSGSIGLLDRLDEVVDIKKNIIVTNKDKDKDRNEVKEGSDVVSEVVQEQVCTLRSYTVGSSIESIMKNN